MSLSAREYFDIGFSSLDRKKKIIVSMLLVRDPELTYQIIKLGERIHERKQFGKMLRSQFPWWKRLLIAIKERLS